MIEIIIILPYSLVLLVLGMELGIWMERKKWRGKLK
jgi:ABC-type proline/glycine betaine transport system permease subunit